MGVGNCSGSIIVGEPQTRKCRCLEWAVGQVGTNGTGGYTWAQQPVVWQMRAKTGASHSYRAANFG